MTHPIPRAKNPRPSYLWARPVFFALPRATTSVVFCVTVFVATALAEHCLFCLAHYFSADKTKKHRYAAHTQDKNPATKNHPKLYLHNG